MDEKKTKTEMFDDIRESTYRQTIAIRVYEIQKGIDTIDFRKMTSDDYFMLTNLLQGLDYVVRKLKPQPEEENHE